MKKNWINALYLCLLIGAIAAVVYIVNIHFTHGDDTELDMNQKHAHDLYGSLMLYYGMCLPEPVDKTYCKTGHFDQDWKLPLQEKPSWK